MTYSVALFSDRGELEGARAEWQELAREAAEPNVFYEHWMLEPALELLLEPDAKVRIALVRDGEGKLAGLIPLEIRPSYKRLPFRHLRLWQYKHCYLCTPLIRKGREGEVLGAFHLWLKSARGIPKLMLWNWIGADGPVFQALEALCETRGFSQREEGFVRALLVKRANVDSEAHIEAVLSGSHRRDMRRLEKRLGEMGTFGFDSLGGDGDLGAWVAEFLELETRGWKGRQGTAMRCHENDRRYFEACVSHAFANGRIATLEARLDGKAIASRCNFLAGDAAFSFKIAFDEAFSKSRPGLLLEIQHIRQFYSYAIKKVDYCSDPGHPMLDRLTEDRSGIKSVAIGLRPWLEGAVIRVAQWLETARKRWQEREGPPRIADSQKKKEPPAIASGESQEIDRATG